MYASASSYLKTSGKPFDANLLRPINFLKAQLRHMDVRTATVTPAPVAPSEFYDEKYPASETPRTGYPNPEQPRHGFAEHPPFTGYPNPETPRKGYRENLDLEWQTVNGRVPSGSSIAKYANTKDPEVFGPALWFVLHNSAAHYPENASPIMASQMIGFIKGLPAMIPCASCKEHATAHIEANVANLPTICSKRSNLEAFFVEFHNKVNKKLGKPMFTVEQAEKMYRGGAEVRMLKY